MSIPRNVIRARFAFLVLFSLSGCQPQTTVSDSLQGAWRPTNYRLKTGQAHPVDGSIFFDRGRWLVLFYVLDGEGNPVRGSAEGGSYTTSGDHLRLSHLYNLSSGEAQAGLEESPLRRILRPEGKGEPEECTYEAGQDRLTINFPSGNSMDFVRHPQE